jgi:cytochrome c biogenesis protein CcmG/thiol:disulfide interchange protein DsbE
VVAAFFYAGLHRDPSRIRSPLIGRPAPEFELPSLQDPDTPIGSTNLAGRLSLLNVWGTWCEQCFHEHRFLLALAETGAIPIFGLNVKDDRKAALAWLDMLGNPYAGSAFDEDGRVAIDWGVYGAPETFLIGPDGRILHKHLSPLTPDVWERDFVPIIIDVCSDRPCGLGYGE